MLHHSNLKQNLLIFIENFKGHLIKNQCEISFAYIILPK